MSKKVAILGSTGSLGSSSIDVVNSLEGFEVYALAANKSVKKLYQQYKLTNAKHLAVYNSQAAKNLPDGSYELFLGQDSLEELVSDPNIDIVIAVADGTSSLSAVLKAISSGKIVLLGTKEIVISCGDLLLQTQRFPNQVRLIDSEHSSLWQCMYQRDVNDINRLILTASGGPFLHYSSDQLDKVTLKDALSHPNWSMGKVITINSSTLMNKALEVMEASIFWNIDPDLIDVVVQPTSEVHAIVEMKDGSYMMHTSTPDMRLPIQYALTFPNYKKSSVKKLSFDRNKTLQFHPVDHTTFPCLKLAFTALKKGDSAPCYLNAANEACVEAFMKEKISWKDIAKILSTLLYQYEPVPITLTAIQETIARAKSDVYALLQEVYNP